MVGVGIPKSQDFVGHQREVMGPDPPQEGQMHATKLGCWTCRLGPKLDGEKSVEAAGSSSGNFIGISHGFLGVFFVVFHIWKVRVLIYIYMDYNCKL